MPRSVPSLEGLEDVPWETLEDAYGPGEVVPKLLRGLASSDQRERHRSMHRLRGTIWHEGTIYSASVAAVPFLIELATTEGLPDRDRVLELLRNLVEGSSYLDVHQHRGFFGASLRQQPGFEANLAREMAWVEACRDSIANASHHFLRLLEDADPGVRREAAWLLAHSHPEPETAFADLERYYGESDSTLGLTLLMALAKLDIQRARPLLEEQLTEGALSERAVAALAICRYLPQRIDALVVQRLLEGLVTLDPRRYRALPFADDLYADIGEALSHLEEPEARTRTADGLLEVLAEEAAPPPFVVPALAYAVLPTDGAAPALGQLSPLERRVLEAIAGQAWRPGPNGSWTTIRPWEEVLTEIGLAEAGREVIGAPPPV